MSLQPTDAENRSSNLPLKVGLLVLAWSGAIFWFLVQTYGRALSTAGGVDFGKHWTAAKAMQAGLSPYEGDLFLSFNYPLFVGFLYWPLGWTDERSAELVFDLLNSLWAFLGAVALGVYLRPVVGCGGPEDAQGLSRLGSKAQEFLSQYWGPVIVFLCAQSQSLQRLIWSGNVDGINVLFYCLFVIAVVRGWHRRAGVFWTGLILIKVAPVLLALVLVVLGRWKSLCWGLGGLAVYFLVLAATGWLPVEWALYSKVLPAIPYHWHHISISVHRLSAEAIWGWESMTARGYSRWILGLNVGLLSALLVLGYRFRSSLRASPERVLLMALPCLLVFSPLLELIHCAWAIPALALGLRLFVQGGVDLRWWGLWLVAWLLILSVDTTAQVMQRSRFMDLHAHTYAFVILLVWITASLCLSIVGVARPSWKSCHPVGDDDSARL